MEGFHDLIKKRPEYKSFYDYIYVEITNIGITMESVAIIPKILDEKAIELVSKIQAPKKIGNISQNTELYKRIVKEIKDVNFKGFMDFEIFCEACSLNIKEEIVIFTNDSDFYKKTKKALKILNCLPDFKDKKIKVKEVK